MDNSSSAFRKFACVKKRKTVTGVSINYRLHVDFPYALKLPPVERVLGQQFPRMAAVNMTLLKTRIRFLYHGYLFRCQFYGFSQIFLLEFQKPIVRGGQAVYSGPGILDL